MAAAGTGKGKTAVILAKSIADQNPEFRILFIVPPLLRTQFNYELSLSFPSEQILVTSKRTLRELEARAKKGETVWPTPVVIIIGMDTAGQGDVLSHIRSASWDLVVLDEIQWYGRARKELLKTLVKEESFKRVLMMTPIRDLNTSAIPLKGVTQTIWNMSELKDRDGKPLFQTAAANIEVVRYSRSETEIVLLKNVLRVTRNLLSNPAGRMVKQILLSRASSSTYALEQSIRRIRNELVHSAPKIMSASRVEEVGDSPEVVDSAIPSNAAWKGTQQAIEALSTLVSEIESLTIDSKRDQLKLLLERLEHDRQARLSQVCIFCSARATASYLATTLSGEGHKLWSLTSDQTIEDLHSVLDGFTGGEGLLICTTSALRGIILPGVQTFIHYDPPNGNSDLQVRMGRNIGGTHYILRDESGIVPERWPNALPSEA